MSPEKTVGPAVVLSFAGVELDTIRSEARLPLDKVLWCVNLLSAFLTQKKVTLQELQSPIGLLNFACSVVLPGREFLRRLIDLTVGIQRPQHFVRLNSAVKSDLRVWLTFLSDFNGCSFFMHEGWLTSSTLHLYTDASGALGFGAVFGEQWCYSDGPESWKSYNIAVLEFYPIVLSVLLWGHRMKNKRVLFFTDNEALVHVINKNSCRDLLLMSFVRKLVLSCLKHNILFRVRHVPGIHNNLADSLSRLQIQLFQQLAPRSHAPNSDGCPSTHAASKLEDVVTHLISSSLQPSSIPTYRRAWKLYRNFIFSTVGNPSSDFPVPPVTLALLIAHLYQHNYSSSTVNTYVSALGYWHRLAGVPDPTKVFFIQEMLKGYGKVDPRFDMRMLLSIPILTKIFQQCPSILDSYYVSTMFKAMCAMAFYAFLRIGEITVTKQTITSCITVAAIGKVV